MMYKHIFKTLTPVILLFLSGQLIAQQNQNKWGLGFHAGMMTYYGDLSHSVLDPNAEMIKPFSNTDFFSYGVSLQRHMTPAWSLRLSGSKGYFLANQRRMDWKGGIVADRDNTTKALNAKTNLWDASLMLTYHFDNGKLFPEKGFFAPYITAGVGYVNFDVYADLFDENGSRYHYWSDYTVRDIDESVPNSAMLSNIIPQDGDYETQLSGLETEGVNYKKWAIQYPVGLGLKFRLANHLSLNLESILHFTSTDYLDDVAGNVQTDYDTPLQTYAANPGMNPDSRRAKEGGIKNDLYAFTSLSLHFNFGKRRGSEEIPLFILSDPYYVPEAEIVQDTETDSVSVLELTIIETQEVEVESEIEIEVEEIEIDEPFIEETTTEIEEIPTNEVDVIKEEETIIENPNYTWIDSIQFIPKDSIVSIDGTRDSSIIINTETIDLPSESIVQTYNAPDSVLAELELMRKEIEAMRYVNPDFEENTLENKIIELNQSILRMQLQHENEKLRYEMQAQFNEYQREMDALRYEMRLLKKNNGNNDNGYIPQNYNAPRDVYEMENEILAWKRELERNRKKPVKNNTKIVIKDKRKKDAEILAQLELLEKKIATSKSNGDTENNAEMLAQFRLLSAKMDALQEKENTPSTNNNAQLIGQIQDLQTQLADNKIAEDAYNSQVMELTKQLDARATEQDKKLLEEINRLEILLAQKNTTDKKETVIIREVPASSQPSTASVVDRYQMARDAIRGMETSNIFFATNSDIVRNEFQLRLDRLAQIMLSNYNISAQVTGYTDSSGNADYNLALSERRANAVRQYLLAKGVDSYRINIFPNGEDQSTNKNYARRVEVILNVSR